MRRPHLAAPYAAVLVAFAVLAATACGDPSNATTSSGTSTDGPDVIGDSSADGVSVPQALRDNRVFVGRLLDGEAQGQLEVLPMVQLPPEEPQASSDSHGAVWLYSPDGDTFEEMPALPAPFDEGFFGDSASALVGGFVVVVSKLCAEPPVSGDAGMDCLKPFPSKTPDATLVAVLNTADRTWKSLEVSSAGLLGIDSAPDGSLVLSGYSAEATDLYWRLDVEAGTATIDPGLADVVKGDWDGDAACGAATKPAMTFEPSFGAATKVHLPAIGDRPAKTVDFDRAIYPSGLGTARTCYSSGRWLGLPGDPADHPAVDESIRTDVSIPSATVSGAEAPTTNPPRGTTKFTVFNLDEPNPRGVELGEAGALVNSFVSNGNYLAVRDDQAVHVLTTANPDEVVTTEVVADMMVAFVEGPVAITWSDNSGIGNLQHVPTK